MSTPIHTLLVANRGEIARRIMRTARAMGMTTVAVYSDADADAPHTREADLAVRLPGEAPADTYLRSALILDAAARAGADAIHPGYGFLSESGDFARVVVGAGFTWVGPPPAAIDAMGSKVGSKELMRAAGVPTLPSLTLEGDQLPGDADLEALGWPLLVKASAGGGGRGMREVGGPVSLREAVTAARREAEAAFGDGTVFLERYVRDPRHIEVQVLADTHGHTVALFERECSIQRRHQKIVEEAPSPAVTAGLRARLTEAAVAAAQAVGYVNAGTVEFVLDDRGDPWFLEMNTRLQVEHPVTEAVTGLDLVRLQLLIAGGDPLPEEVYDAVALGPQGHAIEARVYAEDPAQGWLPSTGTLHRFEVGGSVLEQLDRTVPIDSTVQLDTVVRVDSGVESGSVVSPHYDPMLAKVIAHAPSRTEAATALAAALARARIHGVTTNRDLLVRTVRHAAFMAGQTDTGFLDRHGLKLLATPLTTPEGVRRHALVAALSAQAARRAGAAVQPAVPSGFRNNASALQEVRYHHGDELIGVGYRFDRFGRDLAAVTVDGDPVEVERLEAVPGSVALTMEGVTRRYRVEQFGPTAFVDGPDGSSALVEEDRFPQAADRVAAGSALAPMPGGVVRVAVSTGDAVQAGQLLVVLEAMKMEHAVHATSTGTVTEVTVAEGDQVETGRVLVVVEGGDHSVAGPSTGPSADRARRRDHRRSRGRRGTGRTVGPGRLMATPLRIANCSGFYGDRLSAAREMVDGGPIDVLTGDWLAELTMLILWKGRQRDAGRGWAHTFLTQMEDVLGTCIDRGIKVVTNAGGLNPFGLAEQVKGLADRLGLPVDVAYVEGDDLLARLPELARDGHRLDHLDTGRPLSGAPGQVISANAYLGGWPIVEALNGGAGVVVCPRITDASLVVGPAAWHHGWGPTEWDRLAGAVVAGHVIECGPQATGGNYAFFTEVHGVEYPGFPIAEVAEDGSSVITKHPGTGGEVSVGTVTAQLLYEIGPPEYPNTDVVARFDTLEVTEQGPDRVRISGATGKPAPPDVKVCLNLLGGWRNAMTFVLTGLDIEEKAAVTLRSLERSLGGPGAFGQFAEFDARLIRSDKPDATVNAEATAQLRVTVKDPDADKVGRRFSSAATELALAGYPGLHLTAPPGSSSAYGVYWPALVPAGLVVPETVHADGRRVPVPHLAYLEADRAPGGDGAGAGHRPPSSPPTTDRGPTRRLPLGTLIGARSGDKGGNANVGLWARSAEAWVWLDGYLSVERFRELLPEADGLEVRRYALPNLAALNFVVVGLLGEGVASSTRPDPQAKGLGEYLRSRLVDIPVDLLSPA